MEVYIGPNGYGKTTKLLDIKNNLVDTHGIPPEDIMFLESEILLLDEMKDTKDNTKSMEYILTELIETPAVSSARNIFETAVDTEITANIPSVNSIISDVLSINGQTRGNDFITVSNKKTYKGLVKINQKDVKDKMGSGQRMHLILELVAQSTKTHIFLDEPEKYSHPSLLHKTAQLIMNLSSNKNVYLATHSPKLLSMIDVDIDNIYILNDNTYDPKSIDYNLAIGSFSRHASILSGEPNCSKSYSYFNATDLKDNIKHLHYREFIEALFSKDVYIVEGVNDNLFIKKMLRDNGKYYDDYVIFHTYGKHHMMIFAKLFDLLDIDVHVYFDIDGASTLHTSSNDELKRFDYYAFDTDLEDEINYTGHKYNTVDFIEHLNTITISNSYLV